MEALLKGPALPDLKVAVSRNERMEQHVSVHFMNGVVASLLFFAPRLTFSSGSDGRVARVNLRHVNLTAEEQLALDARCLQLALEEIARDGGRMQLPAFDKNSVTFFCVL